MTQATEAGAPLPDGAQQLIKQIPSLIGAIDTTLKDLTGKPTAFMLLVFTEGSAVHATNTDPLIAHQATKVYIQSVEAQHPELAGEVQQDGTDDSGQVDQ